MPLFEVMIASTFVESHRLEAIRFFKHLILLENQDSLQRRFTNAGTFFATFGQLSQRAKRVVKVEKKGRQKGQVSSKTVTPTKPSQLATVAPAERSLVSELFEKPWEDLAKMEAAFIAKNPFTLKFSELLEQLRKLNNAMWSQKQKVLRATRHRIDYEVGNKVITELTRKLTNVRVYLSNITDYSTLIVFYQTVEKGCPIIDNFGKIQIKDETFHSLIALLKSEKGNMYPTALKIYKNLREIGFYGQATVGRRPEPKRDNASLVELEFDEEEIDQKEDSGEEAPTEEEALLSLEKVKGTAKAENKTDKK